MKQALLFQQPQKRSREETNPVATTSTSTATTTANQYQPLAARCRPQAIADFQGQEQSLSLLAPMLTNVSLVSIVIWGPPGCGKTSFFRLLARNRAEHYNFKTCHVGVGAPELRKITEDAERTFKEKRKQTALFVDEIHRLTKPQQDLLLQSVEEGSVILLGATTENPSFCLATAVLSRCKVVQFASLPKDALVTVLQRAQEKNEELKSVAHDVLISIALAADGDARTALNQLEVVASLLKNDPSLDVEQLAKRSHVRYDKNGEAHYDIISALHKSMRGGDANASVYWVARMLRGGEKPEYIARRLIRFASEDVGLADASSLVLAVAALDACKNIGMPECGVTLAHCAAHLALAPKSIAVYEALSKAFAHIDSQPNLSPPLWIRNAPTALMKDLGYGKDYVYTPASADERAALEQNYLPDEMRDVQFLNIKSISSRADFGQKWKIQ